MIEYDSLLGDLGSQQWGRGLQVLEANKPP